MRWVIDAAAAIIAHAVDIFSARCIGLAGYSPAVSEQRHAQRIGHFHPFIGIGIDREVPLLNGFHVQASQQGKIAGNHEALDVM